MFIQYSERKSLSIVCVLNCKPISSHMAWYHSISATYKPKQCGCTIALSTTKLLLVWPLKFFKPFIFAEKELCWVKNWSIGAVGAIICQSMAICENLALHTTNNYEVTHQLLHLSTITPMIKWIPSVLSLCWLRLNCKLSCSLANLSFTSCLRKILQLNWLTLLQLN